MFAYELYPKLIFLTLSGRNEDGELEWIGTEREWNDAAELEQAISNQYA